MVELFSKASLFGFFFFSLGIASIVHELHVLYSTILLSISLICFLKDFYTAKANLIVYKKAINHYRGILSCSTDAWISWNVDGEMIGISKKFRDLFELNDKNEIRLSDILLKLNPDKVDAIKANFDILLASGKSFSITVTPINSTEKLELTFEKISTRNTSTLSIWCKNITSLSSTIDSLQYKNLVLTRKLDIADRILDNIPTPVWYRDQNLKIEYCNNTYASILDTSKDVVIKKNLPLISGALFGQGHSLAESVKKSSKPQTVSQYIVVNGTRKTFSISEIPFASESFGYALDNTNLDEAIKNLDKVIAANGEVLESLPTAIAIFGQNTRLNFYNSAYKKMTGFDEAWLSSAPTYGEILEKKRVYRQLPEHADFQFYKTEQLGLFVSLLEQKQDMLYLPNGNVIRRCVTPHPIGGLIFMYDDISESISLQRENSTVLSVQKETINNLIEGVSVFGSDNRLKFINANMFKLWNINENIPKGTHISEFVEYIRREIEYVGTWEEYSSNVISNLTDRMTKTGRILKKDNSVIFFAYSPLPDGSHLHSYIDVTDSCKLELATYEKDQALNIANNLKYEFISSISAEIRNPVNLIIGYTELLEKQYFGTLNEKQITYCTEILNATQRLISLINNVRSMDAINIEDIIVTKKIFDINQVLETVVSAIIDRANKKGITIQLPDDKSPIEVCADKKIIKQIQYHILLNLVSFMSKKTNIKILLDVNDTNIKVITIANDPTIKHQSKLRAFQRMGFKHVSRVTISEQINLGIPVITPLIQKHGGTIDVQRNGGNITVIYSINTIESSSNDKITDCNCTDASVDVA